MCGAKSDKAEREGPLDTSIVRGYQDSQGTVLVELKDFTHTDKGKRFSSGQGPTSMAVSLDGEHWHGIELDPELYANTGRGIYEVMRLGASGFMFVANRPGRRHIRQTVKTPALANCAEGGHLRVDIVYTASSGL